MKTIFALLLALATTAALAKDGEIPKEFRALVFSKTKGYRHASIPNGIEAIKKLGAENHFAVDATEDSAVFTTANLSKYKVVIFLSTIGDILDDAQQTALQKFIEGGGGFVGVHAAIAGDLATEGAWPWYCDMIGAKFTHHSTIVPAAVIVEDKNNLSTASLPEPWKRADEWYNFSASPRAKVHVLASLDESTYKGGSMGKDHPVIWWKDVGKGRMWYTALGHTEQSYTEPEFVKHLLGGIQFTASR